MRISHIGGGIVVGEFHRERGSFRKRNWLRILVIALPVEIPVSNQKQGLFRAVGKRGDPAHFFRQVMGMRQHGEHLDIDRKHKTVLRPIARFAGRNIEGARREQDFERRVRCGALGPMKPNRGLDGLGFARGPQVKLQHQVRAFIQTPGQPVLFACGEAAWRPTQEMTFGHLCGQRRDHETETGFRILFMEPPRFPSGIHLEESVVDGFQSARKKLDRFDVFGLGNRERNDEVPINVFSIRSEGVGLRHGHHQVRGPQLPAFRPGWRRRQIRRSAFARSFTHPLLDHANLVRAQSSLVSKRHDFGFRQPGGHEASGRDFGDLFGPFLHLGVAQQTERRRLVRSMARSAFREDDWGDVFRERQRAGRPKPIGPGWRGISASRPKQDPQANRGEDQDQSQSGGEFAPGAVWVSRVGTVRRVWRPRSLARLFHGQQVLWLLAAGLNQKLNCLVKRTLFAVNDRR